MLKYLILSVSCVCAVFAGQQCGVRDSSSARIVGGSEAIAHSWPWQASLRKSSWYGNRHICGATIINERWLLTAAHCVDGSTASQMKVTVGDHHKVNVQASETTHIISRIIMHELYDSSTLQTEGLPYDIALLEVAELIEFNDKVQPACLPAYEDLDLVGNEDCWITGWGLTKGMQDENVLQELNIEVLTNSECEYIWSSQMIRDSQICVGRGSSGACNGDSGGPIVCPVDGRFVVVGAASWVASGCTTAGYPSVYTRVSSYLPWIETHTSQ